MRLRPRSDVPAAGVPQGLVQDSRLTSSPSEGGDSNRLLWCWKEHRLRFAVHGLASAEASPRSHGVPRRDVPGRVQISVARVSAGHAGEEGLALAALRCDVPARRAALARVRGAYLLDPAGGLVLKASHQQAPSRPQDLAVQPGLLMDVPAWLGGRAPGGAGHVLDLEVFD